MSSRSEPPPPEPAARDRILAAAREVFASTGFSGARVDDIAGRAGVNKAMLYYHVGDKERLYTIVLSSTIDRALAALHAATEKVDSAGEKLQCLFDTFASLGSTDPHFVPIMLREIASGGATLPDEMVLRMASVFRVVSDVLSRGVESGDFRRTDPLLTHISLVGSMMFLVASQPIRARLAKITGIEARYPLEALARHNGDLFLHGLDVPKAAKKATNPRSSRSRK